jgi:hypothetical protein
VLIEGAHNDYSINRDYCTSSATVATATQGTRINEFVYPASNTIYNLMALG